MKLDFKSTNTLLVTMLVVVAVGIAFWVLLLGPKRDEAAKLDQEVSTLEQTVTAHRSELAQAEQAKEAFPVDYQRMVVLGKAVPGDDDAASLLVQITRIAADTKIDFQNIKLNPGTRDETSSTTTPSAEESVSPTEAAAALLPLGAKVGPAGLAVMPYSLTFEGSFFRVADFIQRVDALVKTRNEDVAVDGRLITIDGFALTPDPDKGFPALQVTFAVTTYLTPPGAEAPTVPPSSETVTATPTAATTGASE